GLGSAEACLSLTKLCFCSHHVPARGARPPAAGTRRLHSCLRLSDRRLGRAPLLRRGSRTRQVERRARGGKLRLGRLVCHASLIELGAGQTAAPVQELGL